jgi:hypothetical protein
MMAQSTIETRASILILIENLTMKMPLMKTSKLNRPRKRRTLFIGTLPLESRMTQIKSSE